MSTYYQEEERSRLPLIIAVLLVSGLIGWGLWWLFNGAVQTNGTASEEGEGAKKSQFGWSRKDGISAESAASILQGLDIQSREPKEVATAVSKILEAGNFEQAGQILSGEEAGISDSAVLQLQAMAGERGFRLKNLREVGDLEVNRRKRFALEWEDQETPLFLDLALGENGKWKLEALRIPSTPEVAIEAGAATEGGQEESGEAAKDNIKFIASADSLAVTDSFLQAALTQDFTKAKSYVDSEKISDAKIAAMCILFEEGKYQLNEKKPLRAMFTRKTTAAYLANVLTSDSETAAQFGVNLTLDEESQKWIVSELNLDSLLADYAHRVAGGDVYYTPLVANPQGGETLVIFFDFDEERLVPRTQRQLEIVAEVLRTNHDRKLTLSGHADALGSAEYNQQLSSKRAIAVKHYLVTQGVRESQIELVAEGENRPRRPNETESGEDNPTGRRANRRTEIYLNFSNQ